MFVCSEARRKRVSAVLRHFTDLFQHLPDFALARGLWIGEVPSTLKFDDAGSDGLNLIESLLISLDFPRVFLIKLFAKTHRLPSDQRIRALKGNVVTYEMPATDIEQFITPEVLPHPPEILSSVVSVAWTGKGEMPDTRGLFKVRRSKIQSALEDLKAINPLYKDVNIDEERLAALGAPGEEYQPESVQIRQFDNANAASTEGAGYGMPEEEEEDDDSLDRRASSWREPGPVVSPNSFEALSRDDQQAVRQDVQTDTDGRSYGTYCAIFWSLPKLSILSFRQTRSHSA